LKTAKIVIFWFMCS